jgi:enoyl-CoA hydratase/carnithine racemase
MQEWVIKEVIGQVGFITLNRAKALNALSLSMVRSLYQALLAWRDDPLVQTVALRGSDKSGPFGGLCAGGDIRFFHAAAQAGNPELEDFFTEEYALNHLIHNYPKPYVAFMDGIVMGGGMGISQGASLRLVTERTRMAMPETHIGLFPDVGGGYFLSRCPGHVGEWLALTGAVIDGYTAIACGLADRCLPSGALEDAWNTLANAEFTNAPTVADAVARCLSVYASAPATADLPFDQINRHFSQPSVTEIVSSLQQDTGIWARHTLQVLEKQSPLMLHVTLEQIRRARHMSLAENLRMERALVRHCFFPAHLGHTAKTSETVEGIRALAVDKDHKPAWNPAGIDDVTPQMVQPFFESPWPVHAHPLAHLA